MIQTTLDREQRSERSAGKNEVIRYYYKLIGHEFRSLQLDPNLKNKSVFDLIDYCELLYEKLADSVTGDEESLKSYIKGYLIFNYFINSFIMLHFKGFDQFIKSNEYDFIIYLNVFAFYNTDELIDNKSYTIPLPQLRLMVLDFLEDRNLLKFDVNELYQWLYEYIEYLKKKDRYQLEKSDMSEEEELQEISEFEYDQPKFQEYNGNQEIEKNSHIDNNSDQESYSSYSVVNKKIMTKSKQSYDLVSEMKSLEIDDNNNNDNHNGNGNDNDSDNDNASHLSIREFQGRYPSLKYTSPVLSPTSIGKKSNQVETVNEQEQKPITYIDTPPPIPTQLPPGLPLVNELKSKNKSSSSLTNTPSPISKPPYPVNADVKLESPVYPIDDIMNKYGSDKPHLVSATTSATFVPNAKPKLPSRNSLPLPSTSASTSTAPISNISHNGSYLVPRPVTQSFSYLGGTHNVNGDPNRNPVISYQNHTQPYGQSQHFLPNSYSNQHPQQQFYPQTHIFPQQSQHHPFQQSIQHQQYHQQQQAQQQQQIQQQQQYKQNMEEQARYKQMVMSQMHEFQICGLKNFGSSCYINSTIQLLFGIIDFKKLFSHLKYNQYIRTPKYIAAKKETQKNSKENVLLSEAISGLLKSFVLHGGASIAPTKFIRITSLLKPDFNIPYEQQDSQEFLLFVLDRLHDELSSNKKEASELNVVLFEDYMREWKINVLSHELEGYYKWYKSLIEFEGTSPIHDLFEGHLQNKLICNKCRYESINYSPFTILSLPIPSRSIHGDNGTIDLSDCLRYYTQDEILSGDNAWNCPKCNKNIESDGQNLLDDHPVFTKKPGIFKLSRRSKSPVKEAKRDKQKDKKKGASLTFANTSTKKIHFIKLPPVLFIHLSRFSFNLTDKLDTMISYPLELKFNNHSNESIITYRLSGIINHYGTLKSGHYTSLVDKSTQSMEKGPYWCYFDDELVKSNINHVTSRFKASSKDVYVLSYQRVQ